MPEIIDFDYYVDAMRIGATIRCSSDIEANEEVDGRHWNDLYYTITGSSALYGNIKIDGVTYLGSAISASATVTGTLIDLVQLLALLLNVLRLLLGFINIGMVVLICPG